MKKRRKFLAAFLSLVLAMAMNLSVFAAEPASVPEPETVTVESSESISKIAIPASVSAARSIYGYAADYTDASTGSFTVNAPGSATSSGGITLKSTDFPSGTQIYVSVKRPDGTNAKTDISLVGNTEVVKTFSNAQAGTYTVYYTVYGSGKGWLHCWIY